jgi:hypothetical protein
VDKAAKGTGSSEVMENVRNFAWTLKNKGTDSATILQYLIRARELAKSDPEIFIKIFSEADAKSPARTIESISEEQ